MSDSTGFTIWLTGLPCFGKSTLAQMPHQRLSGCGRRTVVFDGDEVRERLSKGQGYSKEDRDENVRRICYACNLVTQLSICGFLGIDHSPKMAQPTIFGNPVRGNSWAGRSEQPEGVIYEPTTLLNNKFIPDDCRFIWDNLNLMTLNSERSRRVAAL